MSQAANESTRAAFADCGRAPPRRWLNLEVHGHGGFQLHVPRGPQDPLVSTTAIRWKIDWSSMQFACIGPHIGKLLGWTPERWITVQDWTERIHPEERERAVSFRVAQSLAGVEP